MRSEFESHVHLFGVLELHVHLFEAYLNSHVNLFGVELKLYVHSFGDVFDSHVYLFGASLNTTCTYSEWSRPAKLAQGAALLQVGGDEVSAEGET